MKLDSARVEQRDLCITRMQRTARIDAIVTILERHSHDPQAADDVRQCVFLGRAEL